MTNTKKNIIHKYTFLLINFEILFYKNILFYKLKNFLKAANVKHCGASIPRVLYKTYIGAN